jgi:protein TonB
MVAASATAPAEAQESDSVAFWLDWGALTFLIRPDSALGLELRVSALVRAANGAPAPRYFQGRYRPADVGAWAEEASLLLLPDRVAPSDPPTLTSSPLQDVGQSRLIAARLRQGQRWGSQVVLSFRSSGSEPLTFGIRRAQMEELIEALTQAAHRSRLTDPETARLANSCGFADDPTPAPARVSGPLPTYPGDMRSRGVSGIVLIAATIDTSGSPIDVSVAFSTHSSFAASARDAVQSTRYRPAVRDGLPIAVRVCLPVTFTLRYGL